MESIWKELLKNKKNFIFLGEAGCGKSELSTSFACGMAGVDDRTVDFFDLDQTKPLFRSRDIRKEMEEEGIRFHFQEQFEDAPTQVGGLREAMTSPDSIAILDVGGNDTGSRLIGNIRDLSNREDTKIFFLINPYRPWSGDIGEIDVTLSAVLRAAGIDLKNISILCNPNFGEDTHLADVQEGYALTKKMLAGVLPIECLACPEPFADALESDVPVVPVRRRMSYEWEETLWQEE